MKGYLSSATAHVVHVGVTVGTSGDKLTKIATAGRVRQGRSYSYTIRIPDLHRISVYPNDSIFINGRCNFEYSEEHFRMETWLTLIRVRAIIRQANKWPHQQSIHGAS